MATVVRGKIGDAGPSAGTPKGGFDRTAAIDLPGIGLSVCRSPKHGAFPVGELGQGRKDAGMQWHAPRLAVLGLQKLHLAPG
jgi:hypothetical protein